MVATALPARPVRLPFPYVWFSRFNLRQVSNTSHRVPSNVLPDTQIAAVERLPLTVNASPALLERSATPATPPAPTAPTTPSPALAPHSALPAHQATGAALTPPPANVHQNANPASSPPPEHATTVLAEPTRTPLERVRVSPARADRLPRVDRLRVLVAPLDPFPDDPVNAAIPARGTRLATTANVPPAPLDKLPLPARVPATLNLPRASLVVPRGLWHATSLVSSDALSWLVLEAPSVSIRRTLSIRAVDVSAMMKTRKPSPAGIARLFPMRTR